jgi:ArsR family transcriptional regulator, arsenate/arsenite/antimonite-responsive transcriptional repressor
MATKTRSVAAVPVTVCCAPLRTDLVSEDQAVVLASAFSALADPARVRLLSLIANAPGGEACACDLAEPIGKSQPTVSHHLKILTDAGLVTREKRGIWAWYKANVVAIEAVRTSLGS